MELTAIATVPLEYKPRLWKRYVDDILEIVNRQAVEGLIDHLNQVDDTGSIKFTYETEMEKTIPFLDMLIVRKEDSHVKLSLFTGRKGHRRARKVTPTARSSIPVVRRIERSRPRTTTLSRLPRIPNEQSAVTT